jgi:hypothetical protein
MEDPIVRVTKINNEYHIRLIYKGKPIDEMSCKDRSSIGWCSREMMRWFSKLGGCSIHAEDARDRHNEESLDPPSDIKYLRSKLYED